MKKKWMITIGVIAIVAALGLGIYHSDAAKTNTILNEETVQKLVEDQYPGSIAGMELVKDGKQSVYEVVIEGENKKYNLTLDAVTGEVLNLQEKTLKVEKRKNDFKDVVIVEKETDDQKVDEKKSDDKVTNKKQSEKTDKSTSKVSEQKEKSDTTKKDSNTSKKDDSKRAIIDVEAAKKIALAEFAGVVTDIELDEEDGRLIYEIEVESKNGEAEFEIDAYTGEILVISIDAEFDDDDDDNDDDD